MYQRLTIYAVFLLVGFIGGMIFQDHTAAPKTAQTVNVAKQKVKGKGNTPTFETTVTQDNGQENSTETSKSKKRGIFRRIFRRRRDNDTTLDSLDTY